MIKRIIKTKYIICGFVFFGVVILIYLTVVYARIISPQVPSHSDYNTVLVEHYGLPVAKRFLYVALREDYQAATETIIIRNKASELRWYCDNCLKSPFVENNSIYSMISLFAWITQMEMDADDIDYSIDSIKELWNGMDYDTRCRVLDMLSMSYMLGRYLDISSDEAYRDYRREPSVHNMDILFGKITNMTRILCRGGELIVGSGEAHAKRIEYSADTGTIIRYEYPDMFMHHHLDYDTFKEKTREVLKVYLLLKRPVYSAGQKFFDKFL